jgi:hypothetical protein
MASLGTVGLRMSGFPLHAMGALIKGAGGAEVAEVVTMVTMVTGVIIAGVVGWEGNHPMASCPHRFDLEENLLLVGVKWGG